MAFPFVTPTITRGLPVGQSAVPACDTIEYARLTRIVGHGWCRNRNSRCLGMDAQRLFKGTMVVAGVWCGPLAYVGRGSGNRGRPAAHTTRHEGSGRRPTPLRARSRDALPACDTRDRDARSGLFRRA